MSTVQSTVSLTWPSGLEHLHRCAFLCCSSSGSWPSSCCWSSCCGWWGWSGLREHKAGIVCILIAANLLNSQLAVLLADPLLGSVRGLEACVAGKEAIVPHVEAAFSSCCLEAAVYCFHPHLFSSRAEVHSRREARLKTDCGFPPESRDHSEDMAGELQASLACLT